MLAKQVRSKYGSVKTQVDGRVFDSKSEARRYAELKLLEAGGYISCLEMQKKFLLIPSLRNADGYLERETSYLCDFLYRDGSGALVCEDVKSPASRTAEYVIKRKLMLRVHGITIKEIGIKPRRVRP